MSIIITILTVILVLDCILLIGIILLQRGKGQGLAGAFGVGGMEEALGTHAASTAQKITVVLGVIFLSLSIILGVLHRQVSKGTDIEPPAKSADDKTGDATTGAGEGADEKSEGAAAPSEDAKAPDAPAKTETGKGEGE